MTAAGRAEPTMEVQVDPASFFQDVFTERAARLRERVERLREELASVEDADPDDTRTERDRG